VADGGVFICRWIQFEIISGGYEMRERLMNMISELTDQQCEYLCELVTHLFLK
jgi:hypothetical protein